MPEVTRSSNNNQGEESIKKQQETLREDMGSNSSKKDN